ncbi:MAG: rod shape-determining protein MreD [Gammaproteobacteria bacterium]|nr:rod shape-determining protein MreD [Gammaproteobacteria bacterium]
MNNSSKIFTIGVTFVVAMMLMLMPLPEWARPFRPEWLVLTLIYWCLTQPRNIGVGIAWILGLCVDVVQGALLGQYALGFAITAYIAIRFHQRVRNYPLHQQAMFVGMILLPYMSISLWILGILGEDPKSWLYWAPVITSVLVWPWVFLVLRAVSNKSSIY